MAHIEVHLLAETLDAASAHADFLSRFGATGAVVAFTGVVRGESQGSRVDYLYLDWYPGMTEASLQAIAEAAIERFGVEALCIHHRCGEVRTAAPIVFVAAASAHRRAAFEAADYMMDRLKSEAALWKREVGPALDHWIEPTDKDTDDLKRWSFQ